MLVCKEKYKMDVKVYSVRIQKYLNYVYLKQNFGGCYYPIPSKYI